VRGSLPSLPPLSSDIDYPGYFMNHLLRPLQDLRFQIFAFRLKGL